MSEPKLCRHLIVVSESAINLNVCELLRDADEVTRNKLALAMSEDGAEPDTGVVCSWDGLPCSCRYYA